MLSWRLYFSSYIIALLLPVVLGMVAIKWDESIGYKTVPAHSLNDIIIFATALAQQRQVCLYITVLSAMT